MILKSSLKKVIYLIILLCVPNLIFAVGNKLSIIVLDAGHGGKDAGARGAYSLEKNLTLGIVTKVGKLINDSIPNLKIVYTRTEDTYPELKERNVIANEAHADLFVSVHINSCRGHAVREQIGTKLVGSGSKQHEVPIYKTVRTNATSQSGAMTLVLSNTRNKEKSAAMGEYGDDINNQELINPKDPQTAIVLAQYMQAYLARSVVLGAKIQDNFAAQGRNNIGVKQQSLQVLAGSYMPGVLVECGFINNAEEEAYLNSDKGQNEVAMSIFQGIKSYKESIEAEQ